MIKQYHRLGQPVEQIPFISPVSVTPKTDEMIVVEKYLKAMNQLDFFKAIGKNDLEILHMFCGLCPKRPIPAPVSVGRVSGPDIIHRSAEEKHNS